MGDMKARDTISNTDDVAFVVTLHREVKTWNNNP
jgi:hypothetical protein